MTVQLQHPDADFARAAEASRVVRTERLAAAYYGSMNAIKAARRALHYVEHAEAFVRALADAIIAENIAKSKGTTEWMPPENA